MSEGGSDTPRKYNPIPVSHGIKFSSEQKGAIDMNPLDSITGTIITGLVLTAILLYIIHAIAGS